MVENNKFYETIHGNFGFGCMRLPMNGAEVDLDQMNAMVDYFMDHGFNYFDTAHGYVGGLSETALRECLVKRYPREAYVLTNKLSTHFFNSEEEILPLFEKQLEACGVDYFDYYLMHAQDGAIFEKYKKCNAYETALKLKEMGKIRHFGISFHDKADALDRILTEYPQVEIVQIQFNYVDYDDLSVESRKVYEVCEKHNKPVIVMEPVKGGNLVHLPEEAAKIFADLQKDNVEKLSNASYAIRFAASFPNICMVLSGMSDMEQMQDNVGYMENFKPLSEEELEAVWKVCDIFRSMNMIPCTGCHYCVLDNDCPKKIQIPELFACYNEKKTFQNWNEDYYYHMILTRDHGKASDCIKCGKCEQICPQHLKIRDLLVDVAKIFGSGMGM
ncbi:MAG: aldo/keto reductase [Eubacteriales bacterium]|nr:aldo/keto reductase [Eubacteriales bacterium]